MAVASVSLFQLFRVCNDETSETHSPHVIASDSVAISELRQSIGMP